MKNNKGITLIALVVTIIVLLILAGVSIAMLSGENGILSNATKASYASAIADAKSAIGTAIANETTEYYNSKYVNTDASAAADLATYLKSRGSAIATDVANANTNVTVAYDTSTFKFTITYKKDTTKKSESSAIGAGTYMSWTDSL